MRLMLGVALGAALVATAATAQISNGTVTYSDGGSSMVNGNYQPPGPSCCDRAGPVGYASDLTWLKREIDHQTRVDGGHLTVAHEAKLQQALDRINQRYHRGPYARP